MLRPPTTRSTTSPVLTTLLVGLAAALPASPASAQCLQESLASADATNDNGFGHAVHVSGRALIVGSPRDLVDGPMTGAAWIFDLEGTQYVNAARLVAPDAAEDDRFGADVAIEGDLALVGAPDRIDGGRVYLYVRSAGIWTFERSFDAPRPASLTDGYGAAVAIADERLFIGSPGHSGLGAVFIHERDPQTQQWGLAESLLGADLLDDGANGTLGAFVDAAGDRLVISAPVSEKVFVLNRTPGTSDWTVDGVLEEIPPSPAPSGFGRGVALDGDTIAIGSPFDDEAATNAGAVTVFRRGSEWTFEAKLFASDAASFASFGGGCGISCDTLVTGASGRGYTFQRQGTEWTETAIILPPVGSIGGSQGSPNQFGVSGDVAVLGGAGFFNATGRAHIVRGLAGRDCNGNGLVDSCEILDGLAEDLDGNGIPDDCLAGDLDADGLVGIGDLLTLLAGWGPCEDDCDCPTDLNGDGATDITDLLTVLAGWTS